MKARGFILIVVLFIVLSGCRNLSDLPLSDTESPIQEEASFVSPSDIVVTFADPIIEAAVRGALEKPDGNITESELLKITVLGDTDGTGGTFGDINGEITTLSDLKWLKNLTTLSFGDCGIKSLIGVEELKHLEILRLRRNDISDLEPLCNLVQLKELDSDDLGFVVEDMNFDGYTDIRIVEFLPAGPNVPYACWVWDKKAGQYVYDSELSGITSLEVDFENKLIRSFGRASAVEHFEEYYRYIDGSLSRIKEVRTGPVDESDPNQGYSITHELIDGQWVLTEKKKLRTYG